MLYQRSMSEEQYKALIAKEIFCKLKYIPDFGKSKIDFCITDKTNNHLFWAEAKVERNDIYEMLTQLLLTARTLYISDSVNPPKHIGCFDCEKLAIFDFSDYVHLYNQGLIDWKIAPSNYQNPQFKKFCEIIKKETKKIKIFYINKENEIIQAKYYIESNIKYTQLKLFGSSGIDITLVNLQSIYVSWCDTVKPQITLSDKEWDGFKKDGVYISDFFLADVYGDSQTGYTEIGDMKVVFSNGKYFLKQSIDSSWEQSSGFKDGGKVHTNFWSRYNRPPRKEKQAIEKITPYEEILERKDLLVPKDVMERKGAYFTPTIWVEKAHEEISKVFGEDWQNKYYVWDCAAGSGNLLVGLRNKRRLFASTLDESDVRVMRYSGVVFKNNAFQFDFLNDDFQPQSKGGKIPDSLMNIITNDKERERLIILINPPYAEGATKAGLSKGEVKGKPAVEQSYIHDKYDIELGGAKNEVFAQFHIRIFHELKNCKLAEFSKLKALQAPNFADFRKHFTAKLLSCFLVPADTFDNVTGGFPIGFKVWDTSLEAQFEYIDSGVYNKRGECIKRKRIACYTEFINDWAKKHLIGERKIAKLMYVANDFQHNNTVEFSCVNAPKARNSAWAVNREDFYKCCIYFSVRHAINADWFNDRDQFLKPNTEEFSDDFINDCIIFSIFDRQNHISIEHGDNHWVPFNEASLDITESFAFDTLYQYLCNRNIPNNLSKNAKSVYDVGLKIFKYYHKCQGWSNDGRTQYNVNAAFYDIRAFFQGRNDKGKMNPKSNDETYQELTKILRGNIETLRTECIVPKVYEYGFLIN